MKYVKTYHLLAYGFLFLISKANSACQDLGRIFTYNVANQNFIGQQQSLCKCSAILNENEAHAGSLQTIFSRGDRVTETFSSFSLGVPQEGLWSEVWGGGIWQRKLARATLLKKQGPYFERFWLLRVMGAMVKCNLPILVTYTSKYWLRIKLYILYAGNETLLQHILTTYMYSQTTLLVKRTFL